MINQPGSDKLIRLHPYTEHHIIEATMPGGGVMFNLSEIEFSPRGEVQGMTPPIVNGNSLMVIENWLDQMEDKLKDMRKAIGGRDHYGFDPQDGKLRRLTSKTVFQEVETIEVEELQSTVEMPDIQSVIIDTAKRISACIIKPLADWDDSLETSLRLAIESVVSGENFDKVSDLAFRQSLDYSQTVRVTLYLDEGQKSKYGVMLPSITLFLEHRVAKHLEKAAGIAFHHLVGATLAWTKAWATCPACQGEGVHFWNSHEYENCFCTQSHGRVHPDQCTFCGNIPPDHQIFTVLGNGNTYLCPVGQALHYAEKSDITFHGMPYDEAVYAHLGTIRGIQELTRHPEGDVSVEDLSSHD